VYLKLLTHTLSEAETHTYTQVLVPQIIDTSDAPKGQFWAETEISACSWLKTETSSDISYFKLTYCCVIVLILDFVMKFNLLSDTELNKKIQASIYYILRSTLLYSSIDM